MADTQYAFITGAGSGLGQALSVDLASKGIHIIGVGRRLEALDETKAMVGADKFRAEALDVSDPKAVAALFEKLEAEGILVSILVNNAAIYDRGDFLETDPQFWMRSIDINLGGMVYCSHAALKHMVQTGKGHIINVTSFAGGAPLPCSSAYSVSKGATRLFTLALQADIIDRFPDIYINEWIPGALNTGMGIKEGHDPKLAASWGASLALTEDREMNGLIFVEGQEHRAARSLKRKIADLVTFQKPLPIKTL